MADDCQGKGATEKFNPDAEDTGICGKGALMSFCLSQKIITAPDIVCLFVCNEILLS